MAIEHREILKSASFTDSLIRDKVLHKLRGLRYGRLTIIDSNGTEFFGDLSTEQDLCAKIIVHDFAFYRAAAFGGSVGAAEAYVAGFWTTDNLVDVVRILVRNRDVLDGMEEGTATISSALMKFWHWLNKNTLRGSRKNIAAHYDLGNDFFRLFLDSKLMYSSAVFLDEQETLEQASTRKLQRICEKLKLNKNDHLLEIGSGWGGFAVYAALNYGCRVTTATISKQQYDATQERIRSFGLQDKVQVVLRDYRHLSGKYDKIVSIEMVEAVGHQYLPAYYQQCSRLLKEDGMFLMQAITIEDHRYEKALGSVDFIKRYIFPGSFIPCASVLTTEAANAGLRLFNLEDIGPSYALTLKHWRNRFLSNLFYVRRQGFSEDFIRMWEFYLAYCEGGFLERSISNVQMLFVKPGNRRTQWLPGDTS
ncbi:MAG: cyclopropane-fatty-acyl-phospholipid synthase family protein [Gammaproteobacteria bacterium]|nr:cyclopropane-fatty-acyl-phospholipid synthase family protein [Gammaproteobacteria bacterium]